MNSDNKFGGVIEIMDINIKTEFENLKALVMSSDPLEEKIYIEMALVEKISEMINSLSHEERNDWITHILSSLVGAMEAAKVPPKSIHSKN